MSARRFPAAVLSTAVLSTALVAGGALALSLGLTGCGDEPAAAKAPVPAVSAITPVERGKYLVTQVAMCGDCHSPRGERGAFIEDQWLKGSPLGFTPAVPMPVWADRAPALAGPDLGAHKPEDVLSLLTTGKRVDGTMVRPPMPEYRLSKEDAQAVIAYLQSLK